MVLLELVTGKSNHNKIANCQDSDANEDTLEYVSIRFDSWQYQGFEDAKIALMSAIPELLFTYLDEMQ